MEDRLWGPATCVWAGTLSPTCCVNSWSNRDVNPCPVCWPGLLGEAETMRVKKPQCSTNVSYYDSALLFLESLFHFIYRMNSPPYPLPPPPHSQIKRVCLSFQSEEPLIWQKEMKSPDLLSPNLRSRPWEKHTAGTAELPSPRHPLRGAVRQSTAVTTVWISLRGAPDKRRGKCKGAGQRLKRERGSSLWSVWEQQET